MAQVYTYARWSSLEQGKGSTLERQIDVTSEYVASKGWTVSDSPILDKGKSAYTGANIETGNLGKFAERMKVGALGRDVILVVEELDRLSRQPPDVMQAWLSPLIRAGLTVHVAKTGQILNTHMLDHDVGGLVMWIFTAFQSNTESRKKAERVWAAWESKRNAAREGRAAQLGHRRPHWVSIGANDEYVVLPKYRTILDRIFARRLAGAGKDLIAKELNADGVPTWGDGKIKAEYWRATYVGRILRNRAVMGEWQPHSGKRGGERRPIGDPIVGWYPTVIDAATFAAANDNRAKNQRKAVGRGRRISNVLGTIGRCADCGGNMVAKGVSTLRINKDGTTGRHYFLYCERAKVAKTCDNQEGWTYDRVEKPLLDTILALAMDDQHFTDDSSDAVDAERAVYQAREAVMAIEQRVARWTKAMNSDNPDVADAAMTQWQTAVSAKRKAEETVKEAEESFAALRGKVSPAEHVRRVQEIRALMDSEDEEERFQSRLRVKAAIGDLITELVFYPKDKTVTAFLREDVRIVRIFADGRVRELDARAFHKDAPHSIDPVVKAYFRRLEAADPRP